MAILFFDGFDRCTITKDLDRNYWSFQPQIPIEYEKYSFGGYSYDHSQDAYTQYYDYYSPNNGTLPTASYIDTFGSTDYIEGYYGNNASTRYRVNRNKYPAFGSPYGFLSLHNLDISDIYNLAPITYIALSGFSPPQSGQSFLSTRFLGIETKDTTYSNNDKPGRFDDKHPLVAFCSGNTTGLLLSIVKVTGNHLDLVEGQRMTIGLQIEQDNGTSGIFDLNLSADINDYQIRSVYSDISGTYSPSGGFIGKILTIARNDTEKQDTIDDGYFWMTDQPYLWTYADHVPDSGAASICPNSRWAHFGIGITQTGSVPYVQLKIEDIDVLVIPDNDSLTNKDLWDDKVYISGFNYDNVRYFNRTYNANINFREYLVVQDDYPFTTGTDPYLDERYYMRGAVTLIDDVVLSDGSGTPNYFPGSASKVIPFTPGVSGNVSDNGVYKDGPLEWNTNSSSFRAALKNFDGDQGRISSSTSGNLTAVRHSNTNLTIPDDASYWRGEIEDNIGGIKFYTMAKKQFLDTNYQVVMSTGNTDSTWIDHVLLITNGDATTNLPVDRTANNQLFQAGEVNVNTGVAAFPNHPSLEFNDSYIYANTIKSLQAERILENTINLEVSNLFTLESFVYFTGNQPITLFSTAVPTGYQNADPYLYSAYYDVLCYTGWIDYDYYYQDTLKERVRLYFPQNMNTGEWNHVAFTRGVEQASDGYTYPLNVFLNGISGTSFNQYSFIDYDATISGTPFTTDDFTSTEYRFQYYYFPDLNFINGSHTNTSNNIDLGSSSGVVDFTSSYGSVTGSGLYSSPATGSLSVYIGGNQTVEAASFSTNYSGFLVLDIGASLSTGYYTASHLLIEKNNQSQLLDYIAKPIDGLLSWYPYLSQGKFKDTVRRINISVASGDTISLKFRNTSSWQTGINNVYIQSASVLDDSIPVTNATYYLPTGNSHYFGTSFHSHPLGAFANFVQLYDSTWRGSDQSTPFLTQPAFYGGYNYISDLRITQTGIQFGSDFLTRYETNFVTPTDYLKSQYDNYGSIGDTQTLTKTRYGSVQQIYSYNNPLDNQPWSTGVVGNPSGFLFGVKKL